MVAGHATLAPMDLEQYEALEAKGSHLEQGLRESPIPVTVQRVGSMMTLFFGERPLENLDDVSGCNMELFARYHRAMLDRGVYLPPSQYEAFFVSMAHSEADLDKVIAAHDEAMREIA